MLPGGHFFRGVQRLLPLRFYCDNDSFLGYNIVDLVSCFQRSWASTNLTAPSPYASSPSGQFRHRLQQPTAGPVHSSTTATAGTDAEQRRRQAGQRRILASPPAAASRRTATGGRHEPRTLHRANLPGYLSSARPACGRFDWRLPSLQPGLGRKGQVGEPPFPQKLLLITGLP